MPNLSLPRDLQLRINRELEENERILWSAQPLPGKLAARKRPLQFFAIPWTAFAVFWVVAAAGFEWPRFQDGWDFFPLFGVPFVLIGIGLFLAPVLSRYNARGSVYLLTDRRVIAFERKLRKTNVKSYYPNSNTQFDRTEDSAGQGDLVLYEGSRQSTESGFDLKAISIAGIANVRELEQKIRDVVKALENRRVH